MGHSWHWMILEIFPSLNNPGMLCLCHFCCSLHSLPQNIFLSRKAEREKGEGGTSTLLMPSEVEKGPNSTKTQLFALHTVPAEAVPLLGWSPAGKRGLSWVRREQRWQSSCCPCTPVLQQQEKARGEKGRQELDVISAELSQARGGHSPALLGSGELQWLLQPPQTAPLPRGPNPSNISWVFVWLCLLVSQAGLIWRLRLAQREGEDGESCWSAGIGMEGILRAWKLKVRIKHKI